MNIHAKKNLNEKIAHVHEELFDYIVFFSAPIIQHRQFYSFFYIHFFFIDRSFEFQCSFTTLLRNVSGGGKDGLCGHLPHTYSYVLNDIFCIFSKSHCPES